MRHCLYCISCECGRRYITETRGAVSVRTAELGLMEKCRVGYTCMCEELHRIWWKEANNMYRKYKKAVHVAYVMDLVSQPNLEVFLV
jgi:hypothetical protein